MMCRIRARYTFFANGKQSVCDYGLCIESRPRFTENIVNHVLRRSRSTVTIAKDERCIVMRCTATSSYIQTGTTAAAASDSGRRHIILSGRDKI